jgi:hypothetical protein
LKQVDTMTRPVLPILFRDLDVGTTACLVLAVLACALLCPPLVLAVLVTLILAVATGQGLYVPAVIAVHARRPHARQQTLRGPPVA